MHQRLQHVQWLFLDPSVLLNENDTEKEARRLAAAALARRGSPVDLERVERAWMQAIASPRPVHPLVGAIQLLAPDPASAVTILDEVSRSLRSLDTLYSGLQLALNSLGRQVKLGVIGPYRLPGTRARLEKFHLSFPVVALSDEQNLSHKLDLSGRPDPALFTWALRKAGCPASLAAFASDRVDLGLAPAKTAGMTTVWVRVTNYKLRYPRNSAETPDLTANTLGELA
ncbi:MAG TPA: HAD hydrolase-like protein [Symbiobacteriaceae bacterium]|nr:HAD hydrolase-like protein [Symbiobacteriaceae bacterium]